MSPEHVCGLQGYCPGYPHYDPVCPACAAVDRFDESKQPAPKSRAELEAEIVTLRAERAALQERYDSLFACEQTALDRWKQAEAERDRLRAALLRYGQHKDDCARVTTNFYTKNDEPPCTCGFATACPEEP